MTSLPSPRRPASTGGLGGARPGVAVAGATLFLETNMSGIIDVATEAVPKDTSPGALAWALAIGLLGLLGWLVRWLAGTFGAKQDAMTAEVRGTKEAIIALPGHIATAIRSALRDDDERRESREPERAGRG